MSEITEDEATKAGVAVASQLIEQIVAAHGTCNPMSVIGVLACAATFVAASSDPSEEGVAAHGSVMAARIALIDKLAATAKENLSAFVELYESIPDEG